MHLAALLAGVCLAGTGAAKVHPKSFVLAPHEIRHEARTKATWLKINEDYPGVEQVHDDPPIFIAKNFLTPDEARWLIETARPTLTQSTVLDPIKGSVLNHARTSWSGTVMKSQAHWLHAKVANLTNHPIQAHESPQVARYHSSQEYKAHMDAFDPSNEQGGGTLRMGGQRICTCLIYLNTVTSGGGTYFPRLDLRVKPEMGKAVIFFPSTKDGWADAYHQHVAEPAGDEKWVSQIWIRQWDMDHLQDFPGPGKAHNKAEYGYLPAYRNSIGMEVWGHGPFQLPGYKPLPGNHPTHQQGPHPWANIGRDGQMRG